jgi:hypothetical protein
MYSSDSIFAIGFHKEMLSQTIANNYLMHIPRCIVKEFNFPATSKSSHPKYLFSVRDDEEVSGNVSDRINLP